MSARCSLLSGWSFGWNRSAPRTLPPTTPSPRSSTVSSRILSRKIERVKQDLTRDIDGLKEDVKRLLTSDIASRCRLSCEIVNDTNSTATALPSPAPPSCGLRQHRQPAKRAAALHPVGIGAVGLLGAQGEHDDAGDVGL